MTGSLEFRVSAIIFDFDGVLVDTAAQARREWELFATRFDLDAELVVGSAHGRRIDDVIVHWLGHQRLSEVRAWITDGGLGMDPAEPLPGARRVLAQLPTELWAIVSSAKTGSSQSRV